MHTPLNAPIRILLITFISVMGSASFLHGKEWYWEAESAAGTPNFSPFVVQTDDPEASGGAYVIWPQSSSQLSIKTGSDDQTGQMHFTFTLTETTNIALHVRGGGRQEWNGYDSAINYKIEGLDTSWTYFNNVERVDLDWVRFAVRVNVPAGTYTLKILRGEDGTKLDAFAIRTFSGALRRTTPARPPLESAIQRLRDLWPTRLMAAEERLANTPDAGISLVADGTAEGGSAMTWNAGPYPASPDIASNGQLWYTLHLDEWEDVTIWARVRTTGSNADSFWYQLSGADADGSNWNLFEQTSDGYTWYQLGHYTHIKPGTRILRLHGREAGVWVDSIFATVDGSLPPGLEAPPTLVDPATLGPNARFVAPPPIGSDSNDGSAAAPWATLEHATGALLGGQQLYLREGTYYLNDVIKLRKDGTPESWTTLAAYPGERAIIDGRNISYTTAHANYGLVRVEGSYVRVQDLVIQNSLHAGLRFTGNPGDVMDNRIENTWSSGIYWEGEGVRLLRNTIVRTNSTYMDPGPVLLPSEKPSHEAIHGVGFNFEIAYNHVAFGDKEGIDTLGGGNGIIHSNHIHHHYNFPYVSGIYLDAWSPIRNVEVYNNHIHDNGAGISVQSETGEPVDEIRLHHNLLRGIYWSGAILVDNYGTGEAQTTDVRIWNNSFINCLIGVMLKDRTTNVGLPGIDRIDVRNNLFVSNRQRQIYYDQADTSSNTDPVRIDLTIDYNLYDATKTGLTGTNPVIGQAGLENIPYEDFRLAVGSPAINAGDPSLFDPDLTRSDIGALPTGGISNLAPAVPHSPVPADRATGVHPDDLLSWQAGANLLSQNLLIEANGQKVIEQPLAPTVHTFGSEWPYNTIHFWQVEAEGPQGAADGPVWSFKTKAPPASLVLNSSFDIPLGKNYGTSAPGSFDSDAWHRPSNKNSDASRWTRDYLGNYVSADDVGWAGGLVQLIPTFGSVKGTQTFSLRARNTEGDATANVLKAIVWGVNGDFSVSVGDTNGPQLNKVNVGTKLGEFNLGGSTYDWKDYSMPINLGAGGYDYLVILLWTQNCTPANGDRSELDDVYITGANLAPAFANALTTGSQAAPGATYSGTISGTASDPEGGAIIYSKVVGPAWLQVATDGSLSGTPGLNDYGNQVFVVQVADPEGFFDQAWLEIQVEDAYALWHASVPWNGAPSGDSEDANGDGIPNLLAFAMDIPAIGPSAEIPLQTLAIADPSGEVTFDFRQRSLLGSVQLQVMVSEDLVHWETTQQEGDLQPLEVVDSDPDGDGSARLMRFRAMAGNSGRLFLRLAAGRP